MKTKYQKILNLKQLLTELKIIPTIKKDYIKLENKETIENKIYNSRINKTEILEEKGTFIFYHIDKINNKLPSLDNNEFKKQIKNLLFQKEKFEFNKNILDQITKKKFDQLSFDNLGKSEIKSIKLNSIKDDKKFEINSVEDFIFFTN